MQEIVYAKWGGKVVHIQQLLNTLLYMKLFMQSGVGKVFNIQ